MNKLADTILQNVQKTIATSGALSGGDTVLVGVSGGPDSVALLHILFILRHQLGLTLHVAHFNHNWRKSAKRDEDFVRRLAGTLGLPFSCALMPGRFAGAKTAQEERGRAHRLEFFERLAKKVNARAVMLGHTQDDLVETVLMHIMRGSGLQGIRGMLPRRKIQGVCLVRPLLGVTKNDILAYLRFNKIRYRQDPTNRQSQFFRNRIRKELLPFLERKYNPGVRGVLANLADTVGLDYDYLEAEAGKVFKRLTKNSMTRTAVRFDRKAFTRQPEAIRRMLVRLAVERVQGNMDRLTLTHMRAIEGALAQERSGVIVHLPGRVRLIAGTAYLNILQAGDLPEQKT